MFGNRNRGRPEGSLFNSYYTEMKVWALLLSLDCWVLSKAVSSTIFRVFGMTRPGFNPRSPGPLANTLPIRSMSRYQPRTGEISYVSQIDLMKENGFTLKKARRQYPTKTITDVDNADDIALLANKHTLSKSLLHSLEQVAGGIGLNVNAEKTEYTCFNKKKKKKRKKRSPH